jgi:ABC-type nitrate/sulfonate/bicarbonate transport system substrate-binding protein
VKQFESEKKEEIMKKKTKIFLIFALTGFVVATFSSGVLAEKPAIPEIPKVDLVFGHEPYMDHTEYIIGMSKGWYDEVGIKILPEPNGKVISSENCVPVLGAGSVDILSGSAVLFLAAYKSLPPYKGIFWADMFQGYAIMAQPDKGYKSVDDLIAEGVDPKDALNQAVLQMKGKKFGYPTEAAIKGFIFLCLEKGGLSLEDIDTVIAPDAKTVAMMVSRQIDFEVGGVPARITLESKGFKPIITSMDLAKYAEPSPESRELRAIFHDGMVARDDWIAENHDTMLRMCGVLARITGFMNEHQAEAIELHRPFLNSAAGTNITHDEAIVIYESLDPFIAFEGQWMWYLDPNSPLYEGNVIGSHIKIWEEKGLFEPGEVKVEDVTIASENYKELLYLRDNAYTKIQKTKNLLKDAEDKGVSGPDLDQAKDLLVKASHHFEIYNYLDASRFANASLEWINYALAQ